MALAYDSIANFFSNVQANVGPQVAKLIKHPSWTNPFTALFTVWIVAFILEHTLPKMKNYPVVGRKGFWLDIFYLFFIDILFGIIGFFAVTYTVEYIFIHGMASVGVKIPVMDLSVLPKVVQFLIFFIVMDFCQFFAHYLLHRVEFFWKFHKIHHAQETLGFASTRHFHFGEYLVLRPLGWIPFGVFGFSDEKYLYFYAIYMWIAYSLVFFSHCNVKINFGILNRIFITPNTHYWHHAKNIPRRYGVNYASVLTIWDFLFGSFYLPDDPKTQPILGVPNNDVPANFVGQTWYPFKTLFSRKKDRQSSVLDTKKKGKAETKK
ncbi:MAG TPA: sterol desaturase family protein [Bacteroidia bacterium]|nr:sterol desaturase family protein [Bacteroidia bacterium]